MKFILIILGLVILSGCINYQGPYTLSVKDAVTSEGVEGVKVLFYVWCPPDPKTQGDASVGIQGDPTCGGLYEKLEDGTTNKEGKFVVNLNQKMVPITDLSFTLEKEGYDTGERGFGFFGGYDSQGNWIPIIKKELTINITPNLLL